MILSNWKGYKTTTAQLCALRPWSISLVAKPKGERSLVAETSVSGACRDGQLHYSENSFLAVIATRTSVVLWRIDSPRLLARRHLQIASPSLIASFGRNNLSEYRSFLTPRIHASSSSIGKAKKRLKKFHWRVNQDALLPWHSRLFGELYFRRRNHLRLP